MSENWQRMFLLACGIQLVLIGIQVTRDWRAEGMRAACTAKGGEIVFVDHEPICGKVLKL